MRILITLDGSPLAERALLKTAPWATTWGAEVYLLTVLDPRETHETVDGVSRPAPAASLATANIASQMSPVRPTVVIDRGRALESVRAETEDGLRKAAAGYLPDLAVTVSAEFAEDTADAIDAFSRAHSIDFIAISTHGRSGIGQTVLGSVAAKVIHKAAVPVIVIGPEEA